MTLTVGSVILALYAGAARWSAASSVINDRNNTYNRAVSAAEGASEKVLSYMARDFFNQTYNPANLSVYSTLLPTTSWSGDYTFGNGFGLDDRIGVTSGSNLLITNLDSQFDGLYGVGYKCRVTAQATPLGTPYEMAAAVQQDVQLATIPLFQFAIFYTMDLEINPGANMRVTGKVHSNANIYTAPPATLQYNDAVTAVGTIQNQRAPNDPTLGTKTTPTYLGEHVDKVSSLTLPVGTDNSPASVRQIVEVPPSTEARNSPTGQQRYYNKADLIVTTTDTGVSVTTGAWGNFTAVPTDVPPPKNGTASYSFLKTDPTFYDAREGQNTVTTELNVAALSTWLGSTGTNGGASLNTSAKGSLGRGINSIYINDQRSHTGLLTVARVTNGQTLPPDGLTVATALPLYVKGNFNAPNTTPGSTDTSATKPASLVGDAITVLSASWIDANSTKPLTTRAASNTTVNSAFLAGMVPSTLASGVKHYSGGVENFPRFLEDWSGDTLTYNGSMVVMFPSQFAKSFWVAPGTYYNAPTRQWAFDVNFLDYRKLPPGTPKVNKLIRGQWSIVAAK
jgi:hypothetical protein